MAKRKLEQPDEFQSLSSSEFNRKRSAPHHESVQKELARIDVERILRGSKSFYIQQARINYQLHAQYLEPQRRRRGSG